MCGLLIHSMAHGNDLQPPGPQPSSGNGCNPDDDSTRPHPVLLDVDDIVRPCQQQNCCRQENRTQSRRYHACRSHPCYPEQGKDHRRHSAPGNRQQSGHQAGKFFLHPSSPRLPPERFRSRSGGHRARRLTTAFSVSQRAGVSTDDLSRKRTDDPTGTARRILRGFEPVEHSGSDRSA